MQSAIICTINRDDAQVGDVCTSSGFAQQPRFFTTPRPPPSPRNNHSRERERYPSCLVESIAESSLFIHVSLRKRCRPKSQRQLKANKLVESAVSNTDGVFDTMHIRRGDFEDWYDVGGLSADDYYDQTRSKLTKGSTIFIATDERDKSFFDIFKEHYQVYFLDDFRDLLKGIDSHYFGMIDQVVAARGRIFFGSFQSTFSGYTNRIRGYYSTYNKLPGNEDGGTQSYYFAAADHQAEIADVMTYYTNIAQPFWQREFPVSWRDIDKGIDLLHQS